MNMNKEIKIYLFIILVVKGWGGLNFLVLKISQGQQEQDLFRKGDV